MESDYERGFSAGYRAALSTAERDISVDIGNGRSAAAITKIKRRRKPSAYNKEYAKVYKSLKKKHPRTSFASLAKKAHRETKRRMRK